VQDLDQDGYVSTLDLLDVLTQFGTLVPDGTGADFNGDGAISIGDILIFLGQFGNEGVTCNDANGNQLDDCSFCLEKVLGEARKRGIINMPDPVKIDREIKSSLDSIVKEVGLNNLPDDLRELYNNSRKY